MSRPHELSVEPVPYRIIRASTARLDRVVVQTPDASRATWFRKTLRSPSEPLSPVEGLPLLARGADRVDHWSWWHREIDAYRSGLLDALGDDLRAPVCHAIEDGPDQATLWLQELTGAPARVWDVPRFGRAARALGVMQGRYLAGTPLPVDPWLARGEPRAALTHETPQPCDAASIEWLEAAPQTFTHYDCWSGNLFAGSTAGNDDATYLVDWSAAGIGPVAYDLACLVFDSVWMCDVAAELLPELVSTALDAYTSGLYEAGYRGDARVVRRAFAIVAELKFARLGERLRIGEADTARHATVGARYGLPAAEVFARRHATIRAAERLAQSHGGSGSVASRP